MSAKPLLVANIYNPHNQTKAELIAGFVVRKAFFEKIFRDIQSSKMQFSEQHYIIQGVRGMGKTTMLLRIAYEIENNVTLNSWLIPVVFNEEEYGVSCLSDVWEKIAEYLEDGSTEFVGLHKKITKHYQSEDYERFALDVILKTLQEKGKKIILLIDNIGDILEKFEEKEEQRLREVLLTTPEIRLIGATSVFLERFFDYKRPFFDFFKYLYLEGLTKNETLDLMLKLGEAFEAENIKQIVEKESYRIEVLRRLTGGVVRSMVLLFEIFVENNTGSAFKDLQSLIDRVTPLYKDRMDDLPTQQQKIVASLANFWEAATTKELAEAVRMESKVVSAQLMQLVKNRVVEKVETPTKNHLYRIEERFFNIWYLMRFGRKTDQRMLWLVKFMEEFIGGDEMLLQKRIDGHLLAIDNKTTDPKAALYLTEVFSQLNLITREKADILTKKTREYLLEKEPNVISDLSDSILEIKEKANYYIINKDFEKAIFHIEQIKNKTNLEHIEIAGLHIMLDNLVLAEQWLEKPVKEAFEVITNRKKRKTRSFSKQKAEEYLIIFDIMGDYLENKISLTSAIVKIFIYTHYQKTLGLLLTIKDIQNSNQEHRILAIYNSVILQIWDNDYQIYSIFFLSPEAKSVINERNSFTGDLLYSSSLLMLAKKQYFIVKKVLDSINSTEFQPLYYATIHYLKDEYPTDYLRMPPEIKETVEELVAEIEQMAIDYA